jgi:hypothetical protein
VTPPPHQASATAHAPEPPIWAFEICVGCARYTTLEIYELACCCSCSQCCHDHQRNLVALAWICGHCDRVLESVGLYTNWPAAQDARRRTLKQRELDGTSLWRGSGSIR